MAKKTYPQIEENPSVAKEPVVAYQAGNHMANVYQVTDAERESIMRAKEQYARGEFCTESEMDNLVAEWLCPHTKEEINAICDEAEADDEAYRLLDSEQVFAMMESKYPWLCR